MPNGYDYTEKNTFKFSKGVSPEHMSKIAKGTFQKTNFFKAIPKQKKQLLAWMLLLITLINKAKL
jgi:hypothetical protein